MDTIQLKQILSFDPYTNSIIKDVCAKNELPVTVNTAHPVAFVVNLDANHLPGSHWVAMYIDRLRGEYFDSMGQPPIPECQRLLNQCVSQVHSLEQLQDNTQVCGQFCIAFLLLRCRGHTFETVIQSLKSPLNDQLVYALVKPYFPNVPFR